MQPKADRGARMIARVATLVIVLATLAAPLSGAAAQLARSLPSSLTDAELRDLFATLSEPGGSFVSENLVSNEMTFQHVIPALRRSLTPGGVYVGVGPEQNFTYIAALRPRMAVIVDIRRQNAIQHLMYKAIFELSPTRADFVSRLFSRPLARPPAPGASARELFEAVASAPPSDSAFRANLAAITEALTVRRGFALSPADLAAIERVYSAFHRAGPAINYGYRPGSGAPVRNSYATYEMLQTAVNADSVEMSFLSSDESYGYVRDLQQRNLIIPVVGDFAGPTALRAVGDYLRARNATVTAFYVSNVEQYLWSSRETAGRFYRNVDALPLDSTSTFIRSVPRAGSGMGTFMLPSVTATPVPGSRFFSVSVADSAGVRVIRTTSDSAGVQVTRTTIDSSRGPIALFGSDSLRSRVMLPPIDSIVRIAMRSADSAIVAAQPLVIRAQSLLDSAAPRAYSVRRLLDSTLMMRDSLMGVRMIVADSVMRGAIRISAGGAPMGGGLTSGIAPIRVTLDRFNRSELMRYQDVIAMTKLDGWR